MRIAQNTAGVLFFLLLPPFPALGRMGVEGELDGRLQISLLTNDVLGRQVFLSSPYT